MSVYYPVQLKVYSSRREEPTNPEGRPPLSESLGDTRGEPRPGHFGTPERFWEWVTKIWLPKVDRRSFRGADFTRDCVLMDPFGTMRGASRCSRYFRMLFLAFPDLSGPHFTWAANENTIVVNWGFFTSKGNEEILVPSIDIFGFRNGYVDYRVAAFDRVALADALVRAYPDRFSKNTAENLLARMWLWHVDDQFAKAEYALLRTGRRLVSSLPRIRSMMP